MDSSTQARTTDILLTSMVTHFVSVGFTESLWKLVLPLDHMSIHRERCDAVGELEASQLALSTGTSAAPAR